MKKIFLLVICAAFAFTACDNDDTPDQDLVIGNWEATKVTFETEHIRISERDSMHYSSTGRGIDYDDLMLHFSKSPDTIGSTGTFDAKIIRTINGDTQDEQKAKNLDLLIKGNWVKQSENTYKITNPEQDNTTTLLTINRVTKKELDITTVYQREVIEDSSYVKNYLSFKASFIRENNPK